MKGEKNIGYCHNIITQAYPIDEIFTRKLKELKIKVQDMVIQSDE